MSSPERIGQYEVVGRVAEGGMAEILLAKIVGPAGFERAVVLKRILPHLARQPEFRAMFLDEARIVARIGHPNVVALHELGEEDGELYLVMEYLAGETLSSLARALRRSGRSLDFGLSAYVVAEACAGLHAAHELTNADGKPQGLVHRDVSPQNIFVTYDGQIKVLDFGIATAADRVTRTEAGQLKGKFEYMSPEQYKGKPLDRRSDVFALGVVLYEASTGRRLFKRYSQVATLQAVVSEVIVSPSRLMPDYPRALDAICMRALARPVDERYATAGDMRRALLSAMRELEGSEPIEEPSARVGALMHELFADRIAEKREMQRRLGSGTPVTHMPSDEAEGLPELPSVVVEHDVQPTLAEGTFERVASTVTPRRSRVIWGGAGALLAVVGGSMLLASASGVHGTDASAGRTGDVKPPPQASVDPALRTVHIQVETTPPGVQVMLDGIVRGTTPATLDLARSSAPTAIELRRQGFEPLAQSVVPDQDQKLVLMLKPEMPAGRPKVGRTSSGPRPGVSAPGAPTAPAPSFWRFE